MLKQAIGLEIFPVMDFRTFNMINKNIYETLYTKRIIFFFTKSIVTYKARSV
ncbi:uncharacterized protein B0P05DRAFT_554021 [Gilbertella persicaria]|uniref:uncharacterized protein n=1 Tax=Gilbertella persicaria TaxID=101096 RepID=UPI00221FEA57|nr:uncharacterized protein B0P05DRAFT_554021 [Gilbertella persicaria]KAI8065358.1 hypothetical protein B0P05DRAFT_554021 [Gilbertella persicaria]